VNASRLVEAGERRYFAMTMIKTVKLAGIVLAATAWVAPASSTSPSEWEAAFVAVHNAPAPLPSAVAPERLKGSGDLDTDIREMWEKGFAPIGISAFAATTGNLDDAARLARKLKAHYYIAVSHLTATYQASTQAAESSNRIAGSITSMGSHDTLGFANNYSSPHYVPSSVNRYDNFAIFFAEMPKAGTGILVRKDGSKLTVRAVRDGSPAAGAGVRPGEVIASIDAVPATQDRWMAANGSRRPVKLVLVDGGQERSVTLSPAG